MKLSLLPAGARTAHKRLGSPKIALRFTRSFVCLLFVCASALITCTVSMSYVTKQLQDVVALGGLQPKLQQIIDKRDDEHLVDSQDPVFVAHSY